MSVFDVKERLDIDRGLIVSQTVAMISFRSTINDLKIRGQR